ncbi:hypothetical protein CPAR01_09844 [Colletotrichum paranaense]|uniref:Transcription factor domain-containing protein n=1 Tax=Colletotrichum paranaense TaxID=1914294 RepID=A0ABQ9SCA9_9PEZI|nr:uncharacterized protein CPAR01_09844 [Colletotrichum paranaense]KAK1533136.1 hypothetical protein CPAR01_09844 [Colletotrichum paranaense]
MEPSTSAENTPAGSHQTRQTRLSNPNGLDHRLMDSQISLEPSHSPQRVTPAFSIQESTLNVPSTEATATLEFLTHGRRSLLKLTEAPPRPSTTRVSTSPGSLSCTTTATGIEFGTSNVSWDTILSPDEARRLLAYHEVRLAWMHNVVHMPTFLNEFEDSLKEEPRDRTWVALYHALLCTTFFHMEEAEMASLGINAAARWDSARAQYDISLRSLHDANFMAIHTVCSVQTICILMQVAHNLDQSDFISVMIASGIRISQCLNMHRLGPDRLDHDPAAEITQETSKKGLINREIKKRVWWFLVRQDWLQIPYQNTYLLHPSQFNTPQALNCHDRMEFPAGDGTIVAQPGNVYTQSTYTNALSQIAVIIWKQQDRMCRTGSPEESSDGLEKLYDQVLWADRELKQLYVSFPSFIRDPSRPNLSTHELPSYIRQVASTKLLSIAHKFDDTHRDLAGEAHLDLKTIVRKLLSMEVSEGQEFVEELGVEGVLFPWDTYDFDMAELDMLDAMVC